MNRKPNLLEYQRENRKNPTPAEDKLWQAVRNNRLGVRFLRQKQFGWYIADFYCASAQLVVEIDGGIHATPKAIIYDAEPTKVLEARGLKVIRFNNEEVLENLLTVLKEIREQIKARAH